MSVVFVYTQQAVNVNGEEFGFPANPQGTGMQIPCDSTQIIGSFWRIPQTQGARVIGYSYLVATETSVKPQPDALKVLLVKLTQTAGVTSIYMAIADSDNISTSSPVNQLAYLCDGTGGILPVMPVITVPYPILQTPPVNISSTSVNTFVFSFPDNPDGLEYIINAIWMNGVKPSTVPATPFNPSGVTTVAQFVTYATSNLSDFGTWTALSDTTFKLDSATTDVQQVFLSGINAVLEPVDYCFDLTAYSTPAQVNGVSFGGGGIIPLTAFLLTDNPIILANVLMRVMANGTIFDTSSVANSLGINTIQGIPELFFDTTSVVAATAGAC